MQDFRQCLQQFFSNKLCSNFLQQRSWSWKEFSNAFRCMPAQHFLFVQVWAYTPTPPPSSRWAYTPLNLTGKTLTTKLCHFWKDKKSTYCWNVSMIKNCLQKNRLIVHLIFSVLTFAVLTCVIIMIIKVVRYRLSDW